MAYGAIRRRVADTLLRRRAQAGGGAGPSIRLARNDLAAAGTASEPLTRTLSGYNQSGLIKPTPKNIRVLQPAKLRRAHWWPGPRPERNGGR
ncbi:helix-turn-helix domain-containing protein [Hymenobacter caeli]|uniref:HTH crp-type domain-containing protein n=1 Tax=Hymenobacter caeli TaxID=2735894 RepID=A0ABX2FUT6_9BACT|nr:hypothetical protein [Hymenobacter caeli]